MEEKKTLSTLEVLKITRELLLGIRVPMGLYKEIGEPILGAANNLFLCINGMEAAKGVDGGRHGSSYSNTPTGPVELKPEDVGCPEEEAAKDGHEADAE